MTLAHFLATDRDALQCDMAQEYGVKDMQALPISTLATLAVGLGINSRTKTAAAGVPVPIDTMLLACIVDRLSILIWQRTKDGAKNKNRPKMIADALVQSGNDKTVGYDSPEALMNALRQFDAPENEED